MLDSCIFSYYISEIPREIAELKNAHTFGKYTVLVDSRTPYISAQNSYSECVIFGYAVNVFTKESDTLAERIVSKCLNILDVIEFEKMLGGKYIILYRRDEQYYLIGDATCSIPIFYNVCGSFTCTCNMHYLVERGSCIPDKELQIIRESGDIAQAMPYDVTQYRSIKQLIPNHYLSINKHEVVRYINSTQKQTPMTIEKATNSTTPLIESLCEFYNNKFDLYCPITSGRDSRVVLAFLACCNERIHCYTIKHPEHSDNSQDIVIPQKMCNDNHMDYEQISDAIVSDTLKEEIDRLFGVDQYSLRTLRIAHTIHDHYGGGAIINGDIIGQVGKCSLHRDIPTIFATPYYFRCKLHNYSRESKKYLTLWLDEIRSSGECVNTFDLFSIENRMGRWAAQENLIYNSLGQLYLNVFNSRSIIYVWTAVSRKERKKSNLHIDLIKKKKGELLNIPFESDENIIVRLSKANGITYLLSSYAKYYIERIKFNRRKAI